MLSTQLFPHSRDGGAILHFQTQREPSPAIEFKLKCSSKLVKPASEEKKDGSKAQGQRGRRIDRSREEESQVNGCPYD